MTRFGSSLSIGFAALLTAFSATASPFYSIAPVVGTSFPATSNSAVLAPGPIGGPPVVIYPPPVLGVAGAPIDGVNAITTPAPLHEFFFSVDAVTTGAAGAVAVEAGFGQAAGDIFGSAFLATNTLVTNQDLLGLLPGVA